MKDIISDFFTTGGLTDTMVSALKAGSKIVVAKKNGDTYQTPIDFTVERNTLIQIPNSADYYEVLDANELMSTCGTKIIIENGFGTPLCRDYDIYANWSTYFTEKGKMIEKMVERVRQDAAYIKSFQDFKKEFILENPEKVI